MIYFYLNEHLINSKNINEKDKLPYLKYNIEIEEKINEKEKYIFNFSDIYYNEKWIDYNEMQIIKIRKDLIFME
jgi:hypothetical protein